MTDNATFGRSVHVRATTWLSHLLEGSIIFIFRHPLCKLAHLVMFEWCGGSVLVMRALASEIIVETFPC